MASEIKVDTISEKTSAGGVTIDGLLIKDGNISGDVALAGTTPTFTIGDAGAEDAALVFDGNAQDYHVGLDDSSDSLVIGLGSALGTTPAMTVNSSQVVTFAQNPVFPDGGVAVADLDIDGATDIGAAVVDADLFIIDDGAGGTNRKVTASRIKTYAGGAVTAINNATANELVTIGSTTTELDAEANLTFDGTDVLVGGAGKVQLRDTGLYIASNADGDLDIVSDGTAVDSINLESAGGITLDAGTAASGVIFEDDGTEMLRIYNNSSDVRIESKVSDKDIVFRGNDGGSAVTAWTMDMSAGGHLLPGNAATGIYLGVNSATAANLLDDYEEGEITNGLDINGTTQTGYSSGRGNIQYVKVGRLVHMQCYLDTDGNTLATTGTLHMRLPFAVSDGSGTAFVTGQNIVVFSIAGVDGTCVSYLNEGDTTISGAHIVSEGDGNNTTVGTAAAAGATSDRIIMKMAMSYQTD